jgi:hypothetical protein
MAEFDNTNTAVAFVENGLFCAEGVKAMGKKPIVTVKINIDGVDKEVALWFSTNKETGEYNVTKQGNKMLTGQVKEPFNPEASAPADASGTPDPVAPADAGEDIPF